MRLSIKILVHLPNANAVGKPGPHAALARCAMSGLPQAFAPTRSAMPLAPLILALMRFVISPTRLAFALTLRAMGGAPPGS